VRVPRGQRRLIRHELVAVLTVGDLLGEIARPCSVPARCKTAGGKALHISRTQPSRS
jgi:hypothetical protein